MERYGVIEQDAIGIGWDGECWPVKTAAEWRRFPGGDMQYILHKNKEDISIQLVLDYRGASINGNRVYRI